MQAKTKTARRRARRDTHDPLTFKPGKPTGTVHGAPRRWFPNGGDPDAYGLILDGDCLEPFAYHGDVAAISPATEIEVGMFVCICWKDGRQPVMKRLVMAPMKGWERILPPPHSDVVPLAIVEQLNPPRRYQIPMDRVAAMHAVVGVIGPDGALREGTR